MSECGGPDLRLLPLVLLLSGLFVVGAFTAAPHGGGDNAGYLGLAYGLLEDGSYTDAYDPAELPHTKYPPLFPAALALLMAAGARTWVSFKVLVGVFTVASSGVAYLWAGRRLGSPAGFAIAGLFAISSAVVYYSHWILSDPLFVVLTLTALWAVERSDREDVSIGWLVTGVVTAALAYLTRSAGLPLLVAILAWLALKGRKRLFGAVALTLAVPVIVWSARGAGGGVGQYVSEFWMIDPYEPGLGTVGAGDLIARFTANLGTYAFVHVPSGIVGVRGLPVVILGALIVGLALYGWAQQLRERPGPAELYAPLYMGLILLWPVVWGGDRFILPLLPLILLYSAGAVLRLSSRFGPAGSRVVSSAAIAALLIPATGSWVGSVRDTRSCAAAMETEGLFACHGIGAAEFVEAADWMATTLPQSSVVLSRKPRFFYLLSGLQSRTFPFDEDPVVQLAGADETGAGYVLLDRWDALAARYVGAALAAAPGAFCLVRGFGMMPGYGTQLVRIRAPEARRFDPPERPGEVWLAPCPSEYEEDRPAYSASSASMRIPLLEGLDP